MRTSTSSTDGCSRASRRSSEPRSDERLAGLERGDGRAPLGARDDCELSERLARPADRERHDVAVRRRDPDVEPALRDEVDRVGRVVVMEDDLAAPVRAPAREGEDGAHVLARDPSKSRHSMLCHKRYTRCVATANDVRDAAS